jgi:hypothetical protein
MSIHGNDTIKESRKKDFNNTHFTTLLPEYFLTLKKLNPEKDPRWQQRQSCRPPELLTQRPC